MDRVKRIPTFLLLMSLCLLVSRCSDTVHHKVVLPPSRPVNYAGAAADPNWMQNQEQTYKKQGVGNPQAELAARMEFERQQSHQEGSFSPTVTQVVSEKKIEKKESKTSNKKKKNQDNSDPNRLFYTPDLPPPAPATPTPSPEPTPPPIQTIPVAPAVPDDSSQTPPTPAN